MKREGIISAGNWLVDTIKMIEKYPSPGNLTTITRIETGLGGCSHNVLIDLAKLGTGIPLYAGGCVGNDSNGKYILDEIKHHGIDKRNMVILDDISTSYTDVMSESNGNATRTFFHYRGANSRLDVEKVLNMESPARIFHLGYLLLLDELDKDDEEFGIAAAKALCRLQEKGYLTSVDLVSEESDRFRHIVSPCLPYIDYLIINEIEAGAILKTRLRAPDGSLIEDKVCQAAETLIEQGVGKICAIHFPEGGYAVSVDGEKCWCPSITVDNKDIVSSVGAGDAFCAGMLYSIHEGHSLSDALKIANTSARFNLANATSTGGAPTLVKIMDFISQNY